MYLKNTCTYILVLCKSIHYKTVKKWKNIQYKYIKLFSKFQNQYYILYHLNKLYKLKQKFII